MVGVGFNSSLMLVLGLYSGEGRLGIVFLMVFLRRRFGIWTTYVWRFQIYM